MTNEHLSLLKQADEDVVLEGSELYQALINMGYDNFDSVPRIKTESIYFEEDSSELNNYQLLNKTFNDKVNLIYQYVFQDNVLREKILKIILDGNILLDDHAAIVNDFLNGEENLPHRTNLEWLPLIISTVAATSYTLTMNKTNIRIVALLFTAFGFFSYKKFECWNIIKSLRHFIAVQNELHDLLNKCLKIIRRTHGKNLMINEIYEKEELIGYEKYNIILSMKQLIIDIFKNFSYIYYQEANKILNILPDLLHLNCTLTNLEIENKEVDKDENYNYLKSLYYSFILVQSEMVFIIANAYNGKAKKTSFQIPKAKLIQIIKDLTKLLAVYYSKLSKIMHNYQLCEVQPSIRIFRGIPNSIWQDVYVHLDLTSQRIQLAYKQIALMLETIDIHDEKDQNNPQLIECIMDKMNETYKQIDNARNFAEFSTLLIAKIQHKFVNNSEKGNESENLFPIDSDEKIVIINKDPEIEDEVFEEYIKDEYLTLYENSDGSIVQNFKLDKLLAKNFMTELKEALIEKQKSMNERELKALKRMYERILRDSCINKTESETLSVNKMLTSSTSIPLLPLSLPPAPLPMIPSPPPPPPIFADKVITENFIENNKKQQIKCRTPVSLPRVKMLQPKDIMSNVERLSIMQCTPKIQFSSYKLTEETFLGSGENSEEETIESDNQDAEESIENKKINY